MKDKPKPPAPHYVMPSPRPCAHLVNPPGSGPTPEQQRKESARRKGRRTRDWWKADGG